MKIIVCLDDGGGMLFNNRRQSRDRVVCEDIINNLEGKKLFVLPFSESLFENFKEMVSVCEEFDQKDQVFFVENQSVSRFDADEVIVYKWNRVYPADFYCDIDFSEYILSSETQIKGYSHEKITKQVYSRVRL